MFVELVTSRALADCACAALCAEHGHSHSRGHHHSLPTVEEVVLHSMEDDINENRFRLGEQGTLPQTDTQVTGGQLNIRGVYLHILADALGSVVVIISSLIIWLTTWEHRYYVDPALRQVPVSVRVAAAAGSADHSSSRPSLLELRLA